MTIITPTMTTNRRAAYLHVLADALTSLLAIVASWLASTQAELDDPAMGIVGPC